VREREREGEREGMRESEGMYEGDSAQVRSITAEMKKNAECEGTFRKWVWRVIEVENDLPVAELINGGAEVSGCSPQTARRYLDKMCSIAGDFQYFNEAEGSKRVRRRMRLTPARKPDLPSVIFNKGNAGETGGGE